MEFPQHRLRKNCQRKKNINEMMKNGGLLWETIADLLAIQEKIKKRSSKYEDE